MHLRVRLTSYTPVSDVIARSVEQTCIARHRPRDPNACADVSTETPSHSELQPHLQCENEPNPHRL
jgi:hypothetical protein